MQGQRKESPESPTGKQQPQGCPCQQTLGSHPIAGTLRHMPKTRGQLQSSCCCFNCTILASFPPLQPSHPLEHPLCRQGWLTQLCSAKHPTPEVPSHQA